MKSMSISCRSWGFLILLLLLLISAAARYQDFERVTGAFNLEASYHVLLTTAAYDAGHVRSHKGLPVVSFGRPLDRHIPWGSTLPTAEGDYIYSSFMPAGFWAPYAWFKVFRLETSLKYLAWFNVCVAGISLVLLFALLFELLVFNGVAEKTALGSAVLACGIALFSREALLSQGLIYWSQSIYQPILIATLLLLFRCLKHEGRRKSEAYALAVLLVLGPFTEWSGYVLNGGLILLLWMDGRERARQAARAVARITALVAVGSVAYYGFAIGFQPVGLALLERFLVRSTVSGSFAGLAHAYILSFGGFIAVFAGALLLNCTAIRTGRGLATSAMYSRPVVLLLLASLMPLLENLLLLQHATVYSFDRLKFMVPASIVIAFAIARCHAVFRALFLGAIVFSCVQGWNSYRSDLKQYAGWAATDASNQALARQVRPYDHACAVYVSNGVVRGYANLLFGRGIYENRTLQDAVKLMQERRACSAVYIEGEAVLPSLSRFVRVTVLQPGGRVETVIDARD